MRVPRAKAQRIFVFFNRNDHPNARSGCPFYEHLTIVLLAILLASWGVRSASAEEKCRSMPIVAFKTVDGQRFARQGHGAVFANGSHTTTWRSRDRAPEIAYSFDSLYLVTDDHVVSGADLILGVCNGKTYPLRIRKGSGTLDLAVLEFADARKSGEANGPLMDQLVKELVPAFSTSGGNIEFLSEKKASLFALPRVLLHDTVKKQDLEVTYPMAQFASGLDPETPLPGHSRQLIINSAVRPGMSGAPAFVGPDGLFFLGLVARTRKNGSDTILIPADDVRSAVEVLLQGKDPAAEIGYALLQSHYSREGNRLLKHQGLRLVRQSEDAKNIFLSDSCQSHGFSLVNEWSLVGGGDYGGPGGEGETPRKDEILGYTKSLNFPSMKKEFWAGKWFYYPGKSDCIKEGVLLPDGRRLIGLRDVWIPQQDTKKKEFRPVVRIGSVEELEVISRIYGAKTWNFILENGLFEEGPESSRELSPNDLACRVTNARTPESIQGLPGPCKEVYQTPLLEMGVQTNLTEIYQNVSAQALGCDIRSKSGRSLRLLEKSSNPRIEIDLQVEAERLRGKVRFGNCEQRVDQPKDFWFANVNGSQLSFSLESRAEKDQLVYELTPLRLTQTCMSKEEEAQKTFLLRKYRWQFQ